MNLVRVLTALGLLTSCFGPAACVARPASKRESSAIQATAPDTHALRAAIDGSQRSEKERTRDIYRHPFETLSFFGVRDDMRVIELWPGGGWYSSILAPLVREHGALIVASGDPNGDSHAEPTQDAKAFIARVERQPDVFDRVTRIVVPTSGDITLGPPASADAVLTFRNLHTFVWLNMDRQVLAAAFRVLKHGGTLGLTDHRAVPGGSTDPKILGNSGYIPEAFAIKVVEAAGFRFVAKSEINANPKDTKDYDGGVWALPPTYTNGEKDHARYEAIGESDRMTLKFVKP
jgi:predicted methyltransferase